MYVSTTTLSKDACHHPAHLALDSDRPVAEPLLAAPRPSLCRRRNVLLIAAPTRLEPRLSLGRIAARSPEER